MQDVPLGELHGVMRQRTIGVRQGSDADQRTTALVNFDTTDGELVAFQFGLQE